MFKMDIFWKNVALYLCDPADVKHTDIEDQEKLFNI